MADFLKSPSPSLRRNLRLRPNKRLLIFFRTEQRHFLFPLPVIKNPAVSSIWSISAVARRTFSLVKIFRLCVFACISSLITFLSFFLHRRSSVQKNSNLIPKTAAPTDRKVSRAAANRIRPVNRRSRSEQGRFVSTSLSFLHKREIERFRISPVKPKT